MTVIYDLLNQAISDDFELCPSRSLTYCRHFQMQFLGDRLQNGLLYAVGLCLSVLSVCNVGVLWPNGWMDQDETWHAGRPQPWPHCVRWRPSSPSPKGHSPPFSAHICCGQAGWIKLPLGIEVCLGPGHIVLDGDPAHPLSLIHI